MKQLKTIQSPGPNLKPTDKFSVLFLVAGHDASRTLPLAGAAWQLVQTVSPLDRDKFAPLAKKVFAVYYDTDPISIDFQHNVKQLVVPTAQQNRVLDRINQRTVPLDMTNQTSPQVWPARMVWEPAGRFGKGGSLIVVLVEGDAEGELYELSSSPELPIPFVAVVMFGHQWHKVIARAIAQALAYLVDEYELPGNENRVAAMPSHILQRDNVILLLDRHRALLEAGHQLPEVEEWFGKGWLFSKNAVLAFHEHPSGGASPDDTLRKATGKIQLVEGGAGYRLNAVRCDFDCLLRRKPYSTQLPIQDKETQFCPICTYALSYAVTVNDPFRRFETQRVLLDSQRPLTDTVYWKEIIKQQPPRGQFATGLVDGPRGARWEYKLSVDDTLGLEVTEVKLRDLPGVIYGPRMDVFARIGFRDLAVKFAGEPPRKLSFADALANTKSPPTLEALDKAPDKLYLRGHRLSLTWAIPGRWDVEAVMSFVFKDVKNDFDPGGAVNAVKCYPQLSMRYRRPATRSKTKLPKVEYLQGTIELVPNNVIPPSLAASLPHHLHHMATGTQSVGLFTDSNASVWDSEWDWDRLDLPEFANNIGLVTVLHYLTFTLAPGSAPTPPSGLWKAAWLSGRLLASVGWGTIVLPSSIVGSSARRAHVFHNQPTLPHWSWLFDYVQADVKRIAPLDRVLQCEGQCSQWWARGRVPPQAPRLAHVRRSAPGSGHPPPGRRYTRSILKNPRQGFFDNMHIQPDMGKDSDGRKVVPAPFCGDLCLHLHWRWGGSP